MDASQHRFELANRLLSDALDQPRSERLAFVTRNCGDDASLRESVVRLLDQFENLGNFMERPAESLLSATSGYRQGTILADRFKIEALLGRGGMGEVYRARDLALGDTVAVKAIRAEWRSDPATLVRFRDEIRLARRISSDHVCKLFDLFTAVEEDGSETVFFTMDYLDGETLSVIIAQESPVPRERLLDLAGGIAEGLDAAHRHGIIHRDLKPANVIVVRDPGGRERAVITDFGLAKREDPQSGSVTEPGLLVGSPDYMAPEQFLGEVLTPAADIFAFGLILYEMAAAKPPYPRDTLIRTAMRRITGRPTPLGEAAPGHWDDILRRALDPNPARRPVSARDLVRELRGRPPFARTALSRRTVLIAGGVLLVSGVVGISRYYQRALPAAPFIMLTPVVSPSPETARSLDVQIEKGLMQSSHVRILPDAEVLRAWKLLGNSTPLPEHLDPLTAREIALRRGANFVLSGNLGRVGDEWVLTMRLELMGNSAGHPQEEFSSHFYATTDAALLTTAAKAVDWVRSTAGEPSADLRARSRPGEEVTTRSWEALKEYTAAKEAWFKRPQDGELPPDQREAAEAHLERALALDPDFATAASLLGDIQVASHKIDEGLRNYQRAAQAISKRNLTDREALLLWGLFALDTGQYANAEQVFSRYALQYPNEGLPLFYKARAVENQGNVEAALHLLDLAVEKDPGSYSFRLNRAIRRIILGQLDAAAQDVARCAAIDPGDWTDQVRSTLAFARFDADGVWSFLEKMRTSGSVAYRSKAYVLQGCFRAEQGKSQDSDNLFQQGLQFDAENRMPLQARIEKLRLLAQARIRRGEKNGAAAYARRILDEPGGMRSVLDAGAILAQAGDLDGARRCVPEHLPKTAPPTPPESLPPGAAPELMEWPIYWHRILSLWAELAMAEGEPSVALGLLRKSPPGEAIQEWPEALIRASIAAGEPKTAANQLEKLFANPAAYWVPADLSGPGFMRLAISQAKTLGIAETSWTRLSKFLG